MFVGLKGPGKIIWRDSAGNVIDVVTIDIDVISHRRDAMQRLDFELNGGVITSTVKVKDAEGVEQEQVVRKQNIIKGRVVINERDVTIEREGDCFPPIVVAELVNGELVIAGTPAVPEGERPPAQVSVGGPIPAPDFEPDAERLARERNEAEVEVAVDPVTASSFVTSGFVVQAPPPADLAAENEAQSEREAAERAKR